ncbi:HHHH-motif protein [Variovorax gossypii]
MKTKQLIFAGILAFAGVALLAPGVASAAPHHQPKHKVCKWDARHHHRVCHWVR